jgi:hypothetical protein
MAEQTWRLVPVVPTQEMTEAGAGSIDDNGGNARWSDVREAWATMLEAAPTPPAPQAMPPVTLPELPPVEPGMCLVCDIQDYAEAYALTAIADDRKLRGGE